MCGQSFAGGVVPYDNGTYGWDIFVNTTHNECYMQKTYDKGTNVVIAYQRQANGWWMGIGRDDWADRIRQDTNYRLVMRTDTESWQGSFHGHINNGHGAFLSNDTLSMDFLRWFAGARKLDVWVGNGSNLVYLRGLDLNGTMDALTRLGECQRRQGFGRNNNGYQT